MQVTTDQPARFKFFFDGEEVPEPKNIGQFISVIKRDVGINGILLSNESTFEFYGDAYKILKEKFDANSFCDEVEVEIQDSILQNGTYETIETGLIKIPTVDFDTKDGIATCKVEDNSFYARINNNKNLKAHINVGKSKNGLDITAPTMVEATLLSPCNGLDDGGKKYMYRVFDAFTFIIAYMTDGQVEFDSPVFNSTGDYYDTVIATGEYLKQGSLNPVTSHPKFSFFDLFNNFNNKLHLGIYIDNSGVKPKLIIDYYDAIFEDDIVLDLHDIPGIKISTDTDKLFSTLTVGNSKIIDSDGDCASSNMSFFEATNFIGYKEETYNILGQCNIDRDLTLTCDYVFDTNIIEALVMYNDDGYDDDIVVIDCEPQGISLTKVDSRKGDIYQVGTPPYFFNERFTNKFVTINYLKSVPNSIVEWLGDGDDEFTAEKTANQTGTHVSGIIYETLPVVFPNDSTGIGTDPNNNYSAGANEFIAPLAGVYNFKTYLIVQAVTPFQTSQVTLGFKVYDAGGVFIRDEFYYNQTNIGNQGGTLGQPLVAVKNISLQLGEKVRVYFKHDNASNNYTIAAGSYFQCVQAADGGGIYQVYDPRDYNAIKFKFSFPLSQSDFDLVLAKPKGKIKFDDGVKFYQAWIDNMGYNRSMQSAEFILSNRQRT